MAADSRIEWTESTWNPVTGCTKISAGCAHCYAERMAMRLRAMGQPNYANGFHVTVHQNALQLPLRWKNPKMIFVNSMSDLFHEEVPLAFIRKVFEVMAQAPRHRFQILTKRSGRLARLAPTLDWRENIWIGVTLESQAYTYRINHLRQVPAAVRFLSLEPLLGPIENLDLRGIDWIIVGGESGPGARPMNPSWLTGVRDQCLGAAVPFFFKQWGGVHKKKAGRNLDGRTWDELPKKCRPAAAPDFHIGHEKAIMTPG
jgi:protein gp37